MPKGFSEREKEIIKNQLMQAGKQLFGSLGIRKTTVQDLAKAAGIAKGSFYLFYESKEELFLEILDQVEKEIHSTIHTALVTGHKEPREMLRIVLLEQFHLIESNPFIRTLMVKEEFDYVWRKMPEEKLKEGIDLDKKFLQNLFQILPSEVRITDDDIEVFSMTFRGLFLLALHKKELGAETFPKVITLLINLVIDHIFNNKE